MTGSTKMRVSVRSPSRIDGNPTMPDQAGNDLSIMSWKWKYEEEGRLPPFTDLF